MTISNGSTASADEVLNAIGSNFQDTAQMIFNADYIGFDSRLIDYDTFTGNSMNITGDVFYVSSTDSYIGGDFNNVDDYTVFDDCDDSSVDGAKWTTTAGVTENGTEQQVHGSITGSDSFSYNSETIDLDMDVYDVVTGNIPTINASAEVGSASASFSLGGNTIKTYSTAKSSLKFQIMRVATGYYHRFFDSSWSGWSFIASTSQLELKFSASASSSVGVSTATITFNNIRLIDSSSGAGTLISDGITADSTITNLITTYNGFLNNNQASVAADGSTYENVTNITIHRPSTTGTSLKNKFAFTSFDEIFEYATKYNFY